MDWRPDGTLAGWNGGCDIQEQLGGGRKLTVSLDEPVEARIVDLGAQFPNNWYVAVFSPRGGTRTMLDRNVRKTATVLDAAGRVICTTEDAACR